MWFSPHGCAPRHALMQNEDFSNVGFNSSSLERSHLSQNMWNPSKSDVGEVNRPYRNSFGSPSPTKFRRFSRRLSGEEFCDPEWISVDDESRLGPYRENAMSSYSSDCVQSKQCAEYNQSNDPRFSYESPDSVYPAGFNNHFLKEPLHRNSQNCGIIDQDLRKMKSQGSRWTNNHQKALHSWSSSKHSPSRYENQRHHGERHRRSEPPSYPTYVKGGLNSPGKPLENLPSRKRSPEKRYSSPVKRFKESKSNSEKYKTSAKVLTQSPSNISSSSKKTEHSEYLSPQGIDGQFKNLSPNKERNQGDTLIKIIDQKYRKKKRKKKNKDRRKSRSRSKERRRCSTDQVCKKEQLSQEGGAHLTALSPPKVNSTRVPGSGSSTPCEEKSASAFVSDCTSKNVAPREAPDSYVCAIVKKRRTSTQDDERSAVLKFTRVDSQNKRPASPKKSALTGSIKRSQDLTPTSAKKSERSSSSIEAVTPQTETKPVEKQNAAHRCSPMKGDIKPKALIKPGLRSVKKETQSAHESKRRSKSPQKKDTEDSGRKMVQKTLESYFFKSVSEAKTKVQAEPTDAASCVDITKSADQGNANKSHVRRIYGDEAETVPRAVVQLTPIPEVLISKLRPPQAAADSAPRGRWASTARLAEVRPIVSPAKKRPCESPPPTQPTKVARVTRTASMESASRDQVQSDQPLDVLQPEEDLVQAAQDEAAREAEVTKAAQRNRKRHSRGHKVFAFCDVLQEHIERHPVQNEIPANKWSKWLNPVQSRCLVSAMLDNTDICLNYSLDAERNEEWEEYWVKLARRLNIVCFNDLTNLNTGLRMTVSEWKTCWQDFKNTVKKRVDAMTAKERIHSLGSLDCLLFSKDLYTALINSNGECLGDECPRIWCSGACVGVFCPEPVRIRTTEE